MSTRPQAATEAGIRGGEAPRGSTLSHSAFSSTTMSADAAHGLFAGSVPPVPATAGVGSAAAAAAVDGDASTLAALVEEQKCEFHLRVLSFINHGNDKLAQLQGRGVEFNTVADALRFLNLSRDADAILVERRASHVEIDFQHEALVARHDNEKVLNEASRLLMLEALQFLGVKLVGCCGNPCPHDAYEAATCASILWRLLDSLRNWSS